MGRGLKIGLGVLVAVVALLGAIVFFVASSLDTLVTAAVERYGSEMTQTRVDLNDAAISTSSGEGSLSGLTVGNPRGFETHNAVRMGDITIALDLGTITDDLIVIKEIAITEPEITYELAADGDNLSIIRRNVGDYMDKHPSSSDGGEGPKLVIENLYVRKGSVRVSAAGLSGRTLTAPLPDLHLEDIGQGDGGATPGEAVARVLGAVQENVTKAVGSLGLGGARGTAEDESKGVGDRFKKLPGE